MLLMKPSDYCIILTTVPEDISPSIMMTRLIEKNLAACIQTTTIRSHYKWEGKVENSNEIQLQIKTKKALYKQVESEILALHPYEVPEIIMIEMGDGYRNYLSWIEDEVAK